MAQKVQVVLLDDVDGGPADETLKFSFEGASYEIDLSTAHAAEFRAAVAPWVKAARKTSGRTVRPRRRQLGHEQDQGLGEVHWPWRVRARPDLRRDPRRVHRCPLALYSSACERRRSHHRWRPLGRGPRRESDQGPFSCGGFTMTTLWVGTYPAEGLGAPVGHGEGLWRLSLESGRLDDRGQVTTQAAPSFVARHPALPRPLRRRGGGSDRLERPHCRCATRSRARSRASTLGGAFGCHVLVAPDASALYVCNYGTGELVVVSLATRSPRVRRPQQVWPHAGSGPRADRQESSHAHFACMSPGGTHVLVADLGTDEIRRYRVGERGLLSDEGIAATLPAGSGPRHMAVRGELLYVVCELDHRLRTLRWDRPSATRRASSPSSRRLSPHNARATRRTTRTSTS